MGKARVGRELVVPPPTPACRCFRRAWCKLGVRMGRAFPPSSPALGSQGVHACTIACPSAANHQRLWCGWYVLLSVLGRWIRVGSPHRLSDAKACWHACLRAIRWSTIACMPACMHAGHETCVHTLWCIGRPCHTRLQTFVCSQLGFLSPIACIWDLLICSLRNPKIFRVSQTPPKLPNPGG